MIWNLVFLCLALLGAVLSFGPNLMDSALDGVAAIDFVSAADVVVFGIMLSLVMAMCIFWNLMIKSKNFKSVRMMSWLIMSVVFVAYVVLICSLWADGWLAAYRAWTTANAKYLQIACYAGWLCMVCSGGWCIRAIYDRYFKKETVTVTAGDSAEESGK